MDAILEDAEKYDLNCLAIQETHDTNHELLHEGTKKYAVYTANEEGNYHHGIGIVCRRYLDPDFKRITSRICLAEIQLKNRKLVFISAYAHTSSVAKKNPQSREDFYNELRKVIRSFSSRHLVVIAGDFNAQTGNGFEFSDNSYGDIIGKFSKGENQMKTVKHS